jgi:hypothetical protein
MNKAEFITQQLKPYMQNPSSCGYDSEASECQYLTSDGRMCVFGKNLIDPKQFDSNDAACTLLDRHSQSILKPQAKAMNLDIYTWSEMQYIHDKIARINAGFFDIGDVHRVKRTIESIQKTEKIQLPELMLAMQDLYESLNKQ